MSSLSEAFAAFMASLPFQETGLAIACSGGSDSMALALLAAAWAKERDVSVVALTVDHGLRAESGKEAKQAGKWLKAYGITHVTLKWEGKKPKSNIQEQARNARYRLLTDYCGAHGINALLVAHTLDDQAETFLLRLARGSGVDGLSAMEQVTARSGIALVRPLLGIPKSQLIGYLEASEQSYIDDPSNRNTDYNRIRIRQLMPRLAEAGISKERLALAAANIARAKAHLRRETEEFIAKHGNIFPEGYAVLNVLPESEEIALRVLSRLLMVIGGHDVPPRLKDVERLHAALRHSGFRGKTVAGCKLQVTRSNEFLFLREVKAITAPIDIKKGQTAARWDRFEITLQPATHNAQLGALTQQGSLALSRKCGLKNSYPDKGVLYTLPCLRDAREKIIAVPHLGIGEDVMQARFIPC